MSGDAVRVAVISLAMVAMLLGGPAGAVGSDRVRLPIRLSTESGTDGDVAIYVVRSGDHLWKISANRLGEQFGRPATSGETAPYWRSVIAVNRGRLRSGDPDLIYPGEVIELPGRVEPASP